MTAKLELYATQEFEDRTVLSERIDELLELWETRRNAGIAVTPEQLCADEPQLLDELRQYIEALEAVDSRFSILSHDAHDLPDSQQAPTSSSGELAPGEPIDVSSRFRIERFHARGGLGTVYLALDSQLDRRVAIKIPRRGRTSSEAIRRFEREARITGRLDHPGVIPVYAMKSTAGGPPLYVMRFVEGRTLQQAIEDLHTAPVESADTRRATVFRSAFFDSIEFRQLLQKLVTVCNIAAFAHQQRVIHRDIKPANILIGQFGEVLLLDWGLARHVDDADDQPAFASDETRPSGHASTSTGDFLHSPTETGQVMGTPAFASPEQLLGQTDAVDERTDVYALGATLLAIMTGKLTTSASGLEPYLLRLKRGQTVSAHEYDRAVPSALEAVCRRAMAVTPNDRYSTVAALTHDLECWLAGEAVSVHRDSLLIRIGRAVRRHPGIAAASAATMIVAVVAGIVGTTLLNQKNTQLTDANDQLQIAVTDSQVANQAALEALRSLYDDAIATKFSETTELTQADRDFLEGVRRQYESFASLKGNTRESLSIRAEGALRSGQLLRTLSQPEPAREQLQMAVPLYRQLFDANHDLASCTGLVEGTFQLSQLAREFGDLEQARTMAMQAIAILDDVTSSASATQPTSASSSIELSYLEARLCQDLAYLDEAGEHYAAAIDWNRRAARILEHLQENSPRLQYLLSLGRTCRSLGEICRLMNRTEEMADYSQRSIEVSRAALELDAESRAAQTGLAWSLYDASYCLEVQNDPAAAESATTEGINVVRPYREKYPLINEYRAVEASLLHRRAAIRQQQAGREQDAIADLISCRHLMEPDLNSAGSFQSAQLGLRVMNRLRLIHLSIGEQAQADVVATDTATYAQAFLLRYPHVADQAELRGIIEHAAEHLAAQGATSEARQLRELLDQTATARK